MEGAICLQYNQKSILGGKSNDSRGEIFHLSNLPLLYLFAAQLHCFSQSHSGSPIVCSTSSPPVDSHQFSIANFTSSSPFASHHFSIAHFASSPPFASHNFSIAHFASSLRLLLFTPLPFASHFSQLPTSSRLFLTTTMTFPLLICMGLVFLSTVSPYPQVTILTLSPPKQVLAK